MDVPPGNFAIWLWVLQCLFTPSLFGQSPAPTGIHKMYPLPTEEGMKQVETLLELSEQKRQTADYTEAIEYANDAFEMAKSKGSKKGVSLAQHALGTINFTQRNYAQASVYLMRSLQTAEENKWLDLTAANLSYLGAIQSTEGNTEEALLQSNKALELFTQLSDKKGQAMAHFHLGFIKRSQGQFAKALDHYKASLTSSEQTGFTWGTAVTQSAIGTVYGSRGQYDLALENFEACMRIWQQIGNKSWIADTYHHIGNIQFYRSNYADALSNYLTSLKLKQEIGDQTKIAESYHDIGHIYYKQNQHHEALLNYEKALAIFKAAGMKQRMGIAYNSLGNAFNSLGDIPRAIENYEASIELQKVIGDKAGLIYSYNNIAGLYIDQENYVSARKNLMAAMELGIELEELEGLSWSYQKLGVVSWKTGQLREAKEYLAQSLLHSKKTGNKNKLMYDYGLLAKVDSSMGHFQQALIDYQLFKKYSDSLTSEDKARIIAELKIGYETEKKDHEIQRLENAQTLQVTRIKRQTLITNILISGLILFALLAFFAYNYFVTRQQLKLQTLRNKIASDLHDDVGSTLSSIAIFSEIAQQQSKDVMPLLQTISDSSRKMLEAMTDIVWTINPENDQFENIILRMRSYAYELLGAKDIGFDFTADEGLADIKLPMDIRKSLFLIFKEATNNIMKYSKADKAMFSIQNEKNNLFMVITDNGRGFNTDQATEGNGLKNMKKRALEIGGQLLVESLPGHGTTIKLIIAL